MNFIASVWKIGKVPRQQRKGLEQAGIGKNCCQVCVLMCRLLRFLKAWMTINEGWMPQSKEVSWFPGANLEAPSVLAEPWVLINPGGSGRHPPEGFTSHPLPCQVVQMRQSHKHSVTFVFLVRSPDTFNRCQIQIFGFGVLDLDVTSCSIVYTSVPCDGEGVGDPLQYSCLENSIDRGAW